MKTGSFWLAALLSGSLHALPIAALVLWPLLQPASPAMLLEAYGDSDREGFPVAALALAPGAYREGDEQTPGGDGAIVAREPEQVPKANSELPAQNPEEVPVLEKEPARPPETAPEKSAEADKGPSQPAPSAGKLAGAPGGARLPIGTPSAGGTVGVAHGARILAGPAEPVYPRAAEDAGIQGRAVVYWRIGADGSILEVRIHKTSGHKILDDAALRWASAQRFAPGRRGQSAVESEVTKALRFELR